MRQVLKIFKWIGIVVAGMIAVLLVVNAYFVGTTGTRLARRLAELRQAGDPVQISDLAREPIPPEKNADVFLRRAAGDLDAIEKELRAFFPKVGFPTEKLTPDEEQKLVKLFAAFPNLLPILEQAANCPDSDPQLDCTLPPSRYLDPFMDHTMKHRTLYRVLRARSALLASQGRPDDAVASQLVLLRLARVWRREPMIMGFLVTCVTEQTAMDGINRVLQAGPLSADSRGALDRELALHDTMEGYIWALKSERAYALTSAWAMPGLRNWLTRAMVNDLSLNLVVLFGQEITRAAEPFYVVAAAQTRMAASGIQINPLAMQAKLLQPPLRSAREAAERTRAIVRSLRVLSALQARAAFNKSVEPKLDELGLPSETTIDPFSGEPLQVKKLADGWLVYSVGDNLQDDGGKVDGRADAGVGPPSTYVSRRAR